MIKIYTAGYMVGEGVDRPDWRAGLKREIIRAIKDQYGLTQGNSVTYMNDTIQWLNPAVPRGSIAGQGKPEFYSTRDIIQVKSSDAIVAFYDLNIAKGLGTTIEMGMAYAWQKRIIMIDMSPEIHSLDFNRKIADSVWKNIGDAAIAILFMAEGLK